MNYPELKMILFRTVISGEETKKKKKASSVDVLLTSINDNSQTLLKTPDTRCPTPAFPVSLPGIQGRLRSTPKPPLHT